MSSFADTIFAPYLLLLQQWSRLIISISNSISFKTCIWLWRLNVYSPPLIICKGASGWKSGDRLAYRCHAFKSRPANCSWCTEYSDEVLAITCYCLLQVTLWMGNTSDRKQEWVILPPQKKNLHPSSLHFLLITSHWIYRKSGEKRKTGEKEKEAYSGSHMVEIWTKEAFVQFPLCSYEFKIQKMLEENIFLISRSNCILCFDTMRILFSRRSLIQISWFCSIFLGNQVSERIALVWSKNCISMNSKALS